jgi:hypothetical protein
MKAQLHEELDTWPCKWHMLVILHIMIDQNMITKIECQFPECIYETRIFIFNELNKNGDGRGNKYGPVLDHIIPQREGGSHRLENLRLIHRGCNSTWRRGLTGQTHTLATRLKLSQLAVKQHNEGRVQDYSNPERNRKISIANSGVMGSERAKRGWLTRKARKEGVKD